MTAHTLPDSLITCAPRDKVSHQLQDLFQHSPLENTQKRSTMHQIRSCEKDYKKYYPSPEPCDANLYCESNLPDFISDSFSEQFDNVKIKPIYTSTPPPSPLIDDESLDETCQIFSSSLFDSNTLIDPHCDPKESSTTSVIAAATAPTFSAARTRRASFIATAPIPIPLNDRKINNDPLISPRLRSLTTPLCARSKILHLLPRAARIEYLNNNSTRLDMVDMGRNLSCNTMHESYQDRQYECLRRTSSDPQPKRNRASSPMRSFILSGHSLDAL